MSSALPISSFPCSKCKKECLAELIGTYILVLAGPASVILVSLMPLIGIEALTLIALTFGGTVGILILLLGKYSGTVINPAITVAAASVRLLRKDLIVPYLFFQLMGGLLAGITLRYIFLSVDTTSLGATKLANGINPILGIVIESIGTFFLALSALIASARLKKTHHQALLVGATLFTLIIFIGPLTGAGFNPARSLGPSIASGYIENLYVYFIGPVIGALFAGIAFRAIKEHGKGNPVCLC
ncbi:MAG: MIP/aquaporin family protein [Nitrososphaerales archaeon]